MEGREIVCRWIWQEKRGVERVTNAGLSGVDELVPSEGVTERSLYLGVATRR